MQHPGNGDQTHTEAPTIITWTKHRETLTGVKGRGNETSQAEIKLQKHLKLQYVIFIKMIFLMFVMREIICEKADLL